MEIDEVCVDYFSTKVMELVVVGEKCVEGSLVEKGRVDVAASLIGESVVGSGDFDVEQFERDFEERFKLPPLTNQRKIASNKNSEAKYVGILS
ncbi:hypothetical protein SUGI_0218900 [Cryptomeria japonica]|nr:hypothetical protein SUGI_0218900 [Cryptomeria japonica]